MTGSKNGTHLTELRIKDKEISKYGDIFWRFGYNHIFKFALPPVDCTSEASSSVTLWNAGPLSNLNLKNDAWKKRKKAIERLKRKNCCGWNCGA